MASDVHGPDGARRAPSKDDSTPPTDRPVNPDADGYAVSTHEMTNTNRRVKRRDNHVNATCPPRAELSLRGESIRPLSGAVPVGRPGLPSSVVRLPAIAMLIALLLFAPQQGLPADLDCSDFGTREAANRELQRTLDEYGRDIHGLDRDNDGDACERNGSAIVWSGIGAAAGVLVAFGAAKSSRDEWSNAIGHAVAAGFAGLFLGWLLPGILPYSWTVFVYALGLAAAAGAIEYKITSPQASE